MAKAKRFNQGELAIAASTVLMEQGRKGISKSSMNRYWNGERVPDVFETLAISRVLGVSLDYLVDDALDDPPKGELTDDIRAVLQVLSSGKLSIEAERIQNDILEAGIVLETRAAELKRSHGDADPLTKSLLDINSHLILALQHTSMLKADLRLANHFLRDFRESEQDRP